MQWRAVRLWVEDAEADGEKAIALLPDRRLVSTRHSGALVLEQRP